MNWWSVSITALWLLIFIENILLATYEALKELFSYLRGKPIALHWVRLFNRDATRYSFNHAAVFRVFAGNIEMRCRSRARCSRRNELRGAVNKRMRCHIASVDKLASAQRCLMAPVPLWVVVCVYERRWLIIYAPPQLDRCINRPTGALLLACHHSSRYSKPRDATCRQAVVADCIRLTVVFPARHRTVRHSARVLLIRTRPQVGRVPYNDNGW